MLSTDYVHRIAGRVSKLTSALYELIFYQRDDANDDDGNMDLI